jgi:tetratricopeptide (TPR) repeat protein
MASGPQHDEMLQRANAALQSQRPIEAARIAGEVIKDNPRHPRALQILGGALLMQGKPNDAIGPLEESARGRHDPALDTQLAIALRLLGRPDEALVKLKRAVKRKPPYAAAFHELGYLLFAMERHDEAIETLNRGLDVAPNSRELSLQLGNVLLRRGRYAEAKTAFARVLAVAPGSTDGLIGMATVLSALGEYAPAAECYRNCLASHPQDTSLWLKLGHCLLALRQTDAAYDCFRTAARGGPDRYRQVLTSLVKSGHGRFWLRPSDAARFFGKR